MKLRLRREDKARNQAFSCYRAHELMMDQLVTVHGLRGRSDLLRQLVEEEYHTQLGAGNIIAPREIKQIIEE